MISYEPLNVAPLIAAHIAEAKRILLLTHVNPDGDAIGSLLGMWHALNDMGKIAFPLASSALPSYAQHLPGIEHVRVFQSGSPLPEHDLIIMVDTASLQRVGRIYEQHAQALAQSPLIIVDHHVTNAGEGLVNLIVPEAASCAELVYQLLMAMSAPVSKQAATCLLLGQYTDTQSYQTSSTRAETLRRGAELIDAGAEHRAIIQRVFFDTPHSTLLAMGMALCAMQREGALLWTRMTQEMLRATGAEDEAGDETMRAMQRSSGGQIFVLFKERRDGTVKISLRSVPGINVAAIATRWGGGGHTQASGATLEMGLDDAEREVLPVLRAALQ